MKQDNVEVDNSLLRELSRMAESARSLISYEDKTSWELSPAKRVYRTPNGTTDLYENGYIARADSGYRSEAEVLEAVWRLLAALGDKRRRESNDK